MRGIAAIVCLFAGAVLGVSYLLHGGLRGTTKGVAAAAGRRAAGLIAAAIAAGDDALRAFNGKEYLRRLWKGETETMDHLRRRLNVRQNLAQTVVALIQGLDGRRRRRLRRGPRGQGGARRRRPDRRQHHGRPRHQPLARLPALMQEFARADQALDALREFARMPLEKAQGAALSAYRGGTRVPRPGVRLSRPAGAAVRILSLTLEPGAILVVTGATVRARPRSRAWSPGWCRRCAGRSWPTESTFRNSRPTGGAVRSPICPKSRAW